MAPRFWRDTAPRQRSAIAVAALALVIAFGLFYDSEPDPRFVCVNELTGSRSIVGRAPGVTDAISAAHKYCIGDIEDAAIELIRVYGLGTFGLGQTVTLPED